MERYDWAVLSSAEQRGALARPAHRVDPEVAELVRRIFDDVANEGAEGVSRWAVKLDGREPMALELTRPIVDAARASMTRRDLDAIEVVVDSVRFYHQATKPKPQTIEMRPGVTTHRVWRAIATCGLYVPNGTAPLVSTLIMLADPARIAGVPNRVVVTPPAGGRDPHPAIVAAAAACGVEELWLIGGAQAIAALAFGAGAPKAQKIFGPGNSYVTEAKRLAATLPNGPAIDLPAGPSELMVIADASANATFIAADLLSQAEHDPDAQVILISTSDELITTVQQEVRRLLPTLSRQEILRKALAQARSIRVRSIEEAIELSNLYAPEHLSLQIVQPHRAVDAIENAGAVFVGGYSAETFGDYVVGPSHVLPTDGGARLHSGVNVASFMKSFTVQKVDAQGALALAGPAARMARLEGLDAHAFAAEVRAEQAKDENSAAFDAGAVMTRRRLGEVVRDTRETKVSVRVDLDSVDGVRIQSGVGFFDHMLEQVAQHGGFSLMLACEGDLHIDAHHTIEDCALTLGAALKQALGERRGIARYGFLLPMDEAEAKVSIDLGGRPYLVFDGAFAAPAIGAYPTEMTEHIFRSLAQSMGAAIHISVKGDNDHHKTEACFKAFGRALRQAVRVEGQAIPSTKGSVA